MIVIILLRPEIRLIYRFIQIHAHSFLEVSLKSEIGVPFLTRREQESSHLYRWWDELR